MSKESRRSQAGYLFTDNARPVLGQAVQAPMLLPLLRCIQPGQTIADYNGPTRFVSCSFAHVSFMYQV